MYEHLIIFKFQSDVTSAEKSELTHQLLEFKDKIPGIIDLSAGVNTTEETQHIHGYTIGMRVTFESLQASRDYLKHPVHQDFLATNEGIIENIIVVDYSI